MQTFTDTEVAWAAGLFEGEGWITTMTDKRRICQPSKGRSFVVGIRSVDKDIMDRIAIIMNGAPQPENLNAPSRKNKNLQQAWCIQLGPSKGLAFLALIREFMGERRGARIDEIFKEFGEKYNV